MNETRSVCHSLHACPPSPLPSFLPNQGGTTGVDLWVSTAPAFGKNGSYGDLTYGAAAVQRIENHARLQNGQPLYLNLALQVDHDPQEAPQRFQDLFKGIYPKRAMFNAMSAVLDEAVGNVTAALKKVNMWDDTLLVG